MQKSRKNSFKEKKEAKASKKGKKVSLKLSMDFFKSQRLKKVLGFFLIISSVFLFLSLLSYIFSWQADDDILSEKAFNWDLLANTNVIADNMMGRLGAIMAHLLVKKWFGISSLLFVLVFFIAGVRLLFQTSLLPVWKTIRHSFFFLIWASIFFSFMAPSGEWLMLGGVFGFQSKLLLNGIMGPAGTALALLFSLGTFLIIVYDPNLKAVGSFLKNLIRSSKSQQAQEPAEEQPVEDQQAGDDSLAEQEVFSESQIIEGMDQQQPKEPEEERTGPVFELTPALEEEPPREQAPRHELEIEVPDGKVTGSNYQTIEGLYANDGELPDLSELGEYDPTLDLGHYKFPVTSLLDDRGNSSIQINKQELEANKNRIIDTLNNYSIQIDRIKATVGPTVTLYEIIPAPGVRISKIKNLENDIALSLSALGIRIIAPIPGRGTIGIEVPNSNPEIVSMKSILDSDKFRNSTFELPIGLGKTIANEIFIADLTKMPHLLMAGATGQGKSVGLNAILASILYKKHPALVKFVLVDPKKVELNLFSKIERHFLAKLPDAEEAIVTETRQVIRTLNSLCMEMDNRYDLLKDAQVRNIKEYNTKFVSRRLNPNHGHRFLPYIILFIDEFADLIMTAGKEVEMPIARLAQLSRAVGIHLIIATQRPSVNIITGTIKANFPARMAFRVTSKIDSRTILDTGGADQLIGRGDMLLSTGSDLLRLQCAFIDTPEIERITEFIGSQRAYPDAFHLPEYFDENGGGDVDQQDPSERDDLFEEAARIIVATQQGSTSLLQRKLKLGYNRAGRIIDQLEAAGIVGPFEGSKARDVRVKDEVNLVHYLRKPETE